MSLRHIFLTDFWAKLFSLALAVMIWSVVNSLQQGRQLQTPTIRRPVERAFNSLPITVLKSAEDDRGYRVIPSRVEVVIRGPADLVNNLSARDLQVYIDLTGVVQADKLVKRVLVHHPPGLTAVSIHPPDARIERVNP